MAAMEEVMELSSLAAEGEHREPISVPVVFEKDEEIEKDCNPPVDMGFACIISEVPRPALEEALQVQAILTPSTHVTGAWVFGLLPSFGTVEGVLHRSCLLLFALV